MMEINLFDKEETYPNCTVQVLTNTVTGKTSVGWWENSEENRLKVDLRDCRNELCLKCGDYKQRHKGACDGCRWKDLDV